MKTWNLSLVIILTTILITQNMVFHDAFAYGGGSGGGSGSGGISPFDEPRSPFEMFIYNDMVFVCNTYKDKIQVFDLENNLLLEFGTEGEENGQFNQPHAIIISDNKIYVSDGRNDRVQIFDTTGNFLKSFVIPSKTLGTNKPYDIQIYKDQIFVLDISRTKIKVLDLDGNLIKEIGTYGSLDGELKKPFALKIYEDKIYVADTGNQRIQIFDLNGEFLQKIGKPGDRNGEFRLIDDIEVYNGKIYASDVKRKNIQEFDLSGNFIETLDIKLHRTTGEIPHSIFAYENKLYVAANYAFSLQIIDDLEPYLPINETKQIIIPEWVRNNAGWWAADQISDNEFMKGIQFLINEGVIIIPSTEQQAGSESTDIPDWVKNNAGWWAADQIDDQSFINVIQFLIQAGLIRIV